MLLEILKVSILAFILISLIALKAYFGEDQWGILESAGLLFFIFFTILSIINLINKGEKLGVSSSKRVKGALVVSLVSALFLSLGLYLGKLNIGVFIVATCSYVLVSFGPVFMTLIKK